MGGYALLSRPRLYGGLRVSGMTANTNNNDRCRLGEITSRMLYAESPPPAGVLRVGVRVGVRVWVRVRVRVRVGVWVRVRVRVRVRIRGRVRVRARARVSVSVVVSVRVGVLLSEPRPEGWLGSAP